MLQDTKTHSNVTTGGMSVSMYIVVPRIRIKRLQPKGKVTYIDIIIIYPINIPFSTKCRDEVQGESSVFVEVLACAALQCEQIHYITLSTPLPVKVTVGDLKRMCLQVPSKNVC